MFEMDSTSEFPDEATDREHSRKLERLRRDAVARFPLITKQTAARRLGCGQPDLMSRTNLGHLISVRWQGTRRFPDFQFDQERRRLRPYLGKILTYFTAGEREEGWPVFMWFSTPQKSLNDKCPGDVLALGPARVLEAIQSETKPQDW